MTSEAKKLYMAEYRRKNAEKIAAQAKVQKAAYYAKNKEKVNSDNKRRYESDKGTALARNAAWVEKNKEKVTAYQTAYRDGHRSEASAYFKARFAANREKLIAQQCAYAKANKERVNARNRGWAKRNPMNVRVRCAIRRSRVRTATPAWADLADIKAVYQEAHHMQMHVDHVIPLKHPLVCGLHVWDNLQLLSEVANKAKGNRFDMEALQ